MIRLTYSFAVWPLNEIRGALPAILDRFAEEGPLSPPVIVGRHRKTEAVVVPYRLLAPLVEVCEACEVPWLSQARVRPHVRY
jgi:antitoxin StbD